MEAHGDIAKMRPFGARVGEAVWRWLSGPPHRSTYLLTRFCLLRLLGLVYLVAFVVAVEQLVPLVGEDGLTPVADMFDALRRAGRGFWDEPTLFWLDHSDRALTIVSWAGVLLSAAVLAGVTHGGVMLALWVLYLSIDHVGQRWYQFGWESQLLETGFVAVFLCPWRSFGPFPRRHPTPILPLWLNRWLIVRVMLGAGLIKLRGDACWRELTCLDWHFETQPIPNPISPWLHHAPHELLAVGVMFNHVAELVAPWFLFGPRRARHVAATVVLIFQVILIASGNLSFLNWLTIVPCLACFDDGVWRRVLPRRLGAVVDDPEWAPTSSRATWVVTGVLTVVVGWLSLPVIGNLIGVRGQTMNRSYDRLHLVNTYGAFGSVHDERWELVIEGSMADDPSEASSWQAYELPCKPGDPMRRPCLISPYHYRLDWLMWFAALEVEYGGGLRREIWVAHLLWKLLDGDPTVRALLGHDPFDGAPPKWLRVQVYRYRFAPLADEAWWTRELVGTLAGPVSREDPQLRAVLASRGWGPEPDEDR